MTTPTRPDTVDFHFDVLCPWAYQTSLWMRDVRDQLDLTVNWRFFSLEEVNRVEGKRHPWEREWSYGWSILRIGALLGRLKITQCPSAVGRERGCKPEACQLVGVVGSSSTAPICWSASRAERSGRGALVWGAPSFSWASATRDRQACGCRILGRGWSGGTSVLVDDAVAAG